MSDDEIAQFNEERAAENARDFKAFKSALNHGTCWVCKLPFNSFQVDEPCAHWLLLPEGLRKKHFKILFEANSPTNLDDITF